LPTQKSVSSKAACGGKHIMPDKLPARFNTWDDVLLALPVLARLEQQRGSVSAGQAAEEASSAEHTQIPKQGFIQSVALTGKNVPGLQFSRRLTRRFGEGWSASLEKYLSHIDETRFPQERERIRTLITSAMQLERMQPIQLQSPENEHQDYLNALNAASVFKTSGKFKRFYEVFSFYAVQGFRQNIRTQDWLESKKKDILARPLINWSTVIPVLLEGTMLEQVEGELKDIIAATSSTLTTVQPGKTAATLNEVDATEMRTALNRYITDLKVQVLQASLEEKHYQPFFAKLTLPSFWRDWKRELQKMWEDTEPKTGMSFIAFIKHLVDELATRITLDRVEDIVTQALTSAQFSSPILQQQALHCLVTNITSKKTEVSTVVSVNLPVPRDQASWLSYWIIRILTDCGCVVIEDAQAILTELINTNPYARQNENALDYQVDYDVIARIIDQRYPSGGALSMRDELYTSLPFLYHSYKDILALVNFEGIDQRQALYAYIMTHVPAQQLWEPWLESLYPNSYADMITGFKAYRRDDSNLESKAAKRVSDLACEQPLLSLISLYIDLFYQLKQAGVTEVDSINSEFMAFVLKINNTLTQGRQHRIQALNDVVKQFKTYFSEVLPAEQSLSMSLKQLLQATLPRVNMDATGLATKKNKLIERIDAAQDEISEQLLIDIVRYLDEARSHIPSSLNYSSVKTLFQLQFYAFKAYQEHPLTFFERKALEAWQKEQEQAQTSRDSAATSTAKPPRRPSSALKRWSTMFLESIHWSPAEGPQPVRTSSSSSTPTYELGAPSHELETIALTSSLSASSTLSRPLGLSASAPPSLPSSPASSIQVDPASASTEPGSSASTIVTTSGPIENLVIQEESQDAASTVSGSSTSTTVTTSGPIENLVIQEESQAATSTEPGSSTSTIMAPESTVEQSSNGSNLSLNSSDDQPMDVETSSSAASSTSVTSPAVVVVEPAADKKRLMPVEQLPPVSSLKPHGRVWTLCHYGRLASDSSPQSEFRRNQNFTVDASIASSDEVAQLKALPEGSPLSEELSESFKRVIEHHSQNLASQQQDLLRAQVCRFFGVDEDSDAGKAIRVHTTLQQHYDEKDGKIYLHSTASKITLKIPKNFSDPDPENLEAIEVPTWINLTYVLDTREGFEENTGEITIREAYHLESCEIADTDDTKDQFINWLVNGYRVENDTPQKQEARRQQCAQNGFEDVLNQEQQQITKDMQRFQGAAAKDRAADLPTLSEEQYNELKRIVQEQAVKTRIEEIWTAFKSKGTKLDDEDLDKALDELVQCIMGIKTNLPSGYPTLTDSQLIRYIGIIFYRENNSPFGLEDTAYIDGLLQCHKAYLRKTASELTVAALNPVLKAQLNNRVIALTCFAEAIKYQPFPPAYQDDLVMRRVIDAHLTRTEDAWPTIRVLFKAKSYTKQRLQALKRSYVEMRYAKDIAELRTYYTDSEAFEQQVIAYLADRMPPSQVETWLVKFFGEPHQHPAYTAEQLITLKDKLAEYLASDAFQSRRTPYEVALMKQVQHNYNQDKPAERKVFFDRVFLQAAPPSTTLTHPANVYIGVKSHAKRLTVELNQKVVAGKACTPDSIDKLCKKDKAEGCVDYIFEQIKSGECKLGWFAGLFGGEKIELDNGASIVVSRCQKEIYDLIKKQKDLRVPESADQTDSMDVDELRQAEKMTWPAVLKEVARLLKKAELRHTFSRNKKTDAFYGELRQEIESVDKQLAQQGYEAADVSDAENQNRNAAANVNYDQQRSTIFASPRPDVNYWGLAVSYQGPAFTALGF